MESVYAASVKRLSWPGLCPSSGGSWAGFSQYWGGKVGVRRGGKNLCMKTSWETGGAGLSCGQEGKGTALGATVPLKQSSVSWEAAVRRKGKSCPLPESGLRMLLRDQPQSYLTFCLSKGTNSSIHRVPETSQESAKGSQRDSPRGLW